MGELLSATDIIRAIDRSGNQDGTAALDDIQPHLDAQQKIRLNVADDFHLALQNLNRLCGEPADTFQMSSILRCPVIQNNAIDANKLKEAEDIFSQKQLNRIFDNKQSDPLIQDRYKEFLSFVERNHIPSEKFISVLENYFNAPLENNPLETVSADIQKESLFQMSLYAAMWHLKYNVKAFAPEELKKYPEWFRKKVAGFEENILERLKTWDISPAIGEHPSTIAYFPPPQKKIATPFSNPFPPLLNGLSMAIWHECFHAYRVPRVFLEPLWVSERDADLVEGIVATKMNGINDPKDKRLGDLVRKAGATFISGSKSEADQKEMKIAYKDKLALYRYALLFGKQKNGSFSPIEKEAEEAEMRHILSTTVDPLINSPFVLFYETPNSLELSSQLRVSRDTIESKLQLIREILYPWPPDDQKKSRIRFSDMALRLNKLLEKFSNGMDRVAYDDYSFYIHEVVTYTKLLADEERHDFVLQYLKEHRQMPKKVLPENFPKTFQWLRQIRWIVLIGT